MNLEERIKQKELDIQSARYQIIFYDKNGRRVWTDYTAIEPDPEFIDRYYGFFMKHNPPKAKRAKFVIVIERKFVCGVILSGD